MGYWKDKQIRDDENHMISERIRRQREAKEQNGFYGPGSFDELDIEAMEEWERVKDRD